MRARETRFRSNVSPFRGVGCTARFHVSGTRRGSYFDLICLLAKQVLSQLSYTPTVGTTYILKHFRPFQNPFLRFSSVWSEPLF